MVASLAEGFRLIDAQHQYESRLRDRAKLLEILLRVQAGEWVGLRDRWLALEIMDKHEGFRDYDRYLSRKSTCSS